MDATALGIQFDVKEYDLSGAEERSLREKLDILARQVDHFPVAELRALIQGARSNDISAKLTLILPGRTLVARDHDRALHPAFDRCIESLVHELDAYKDSLGNQSESAK